MLYKNLIMNLACELCYGEKLWLLVLLWNELGLNIICFISLLDIFIYAYVSVFLLQNQLNICQGQHKRKTSFVEHWTFLHLYHSFHRLWILLVMMFQVCTLNLWHKILYFSGDRNCLENVLKSNNSSFFHFPPLWSNVQCGFLFSLFSREYGNSIWDVS